MTLLIEDYALIGNNATAALVGRNGSIDWLSFPRFDSPACFAALLGATRNGHWQIQPQAEHPQIKRRYRQGTLVLETEFTTPEGQVVLVDCMDRRGSHQDLVRLVRGVRGRVPMQMDLVLRFEYGTVIPWVSRTEDGRLKAVAGPNRLLLSTTAPLRGEDLRTLSDFVVEEGQEVPFVLTWSHSFGPEGPEPKAARVIEHVTHAWEKWSSKHTPKGPYSEAVLRSIITLKALTYHDTGGIVAAATTSLPEQVEGVRNWDYRFCWLRDSTFTLYALMEAGYIDEAKAWREWLLRAVAGTPEQMQIMYGVAGERRLTEFELPELPGYEASKPVRVGNAASEQLQLDVYGEVLDSFYQARRKGLDRLDVAWDLQKALVNHLEKIWSEPDDGIWEVRGGRKHFVLSKAMAWVAMDRAVRSIEEFGEEGPLDRWKKLRSDMHDEICRLGFSRELGAFVQYYGATELDASVLLMPLVGFLPAQDPRMVSTVAAIEKHLMRDGFVARYNPESSVDGLQGSEGVFLACSFWLADNYVLQGRHDEAKELFERLLTVRNDVGLLSEEFDPKEKRQLGNFPQAFSHLSLVNTAHNLCPELAESRPAKHRAERSGAKS
ncbi:MAG TPA: glycoside hydrolase family 15 protein [Bryobacteraceae bacterium]|jgi:GH15 family glucan-1,4-alpha-glucosidase|nr:glycoside hydrolase family 15 protein [Bryobacteraceae bacterium]